MESLYSVMQGLESRLGGGEGVEGIYGSITATGMHKILDCMKHNCGLGRNSTLIDIGAGLGRPLLHALMLHGVAHGYGVELDRVKVAKAEAFCKGVIDELAVRGVLHSSGKDATAAAADDDDDAVSTKPAAEAAAAGESKGLIDASQDSGLGTQQAKSPAAAAAAAAADGADPSDVSDHTQVQFDSSQTGPAAAAAAAGGRSDATPSAASRKGKQTSAAAAAPDTGKKGAGAKTPKVKGQVLLWPASRPIITCAAIEQIASLDPGTHAYSFWEGVPLSGKKAFGRLFRISKTMKAVAVVQRAMRGQTPESVMVDLGFGPLMLIKAFPVSMSGSGRSFQAYVFSKVAPPAALLMMRQGAAATEQQHQQQQQQDSGSLDVLASSTKPPRGSRLEGAADSEEADTATAAAAEDDVGDSDGSPDQQQQQLIPLLTEQSIAAMHQQQQQQGEGHSPGKRGQPFLPAAAADGGLDGSPSKKQRGAAGTAAAADALARGGSGLYGLRPRQLSSSFSSGSSSRATSATTTAATAAAMQRTASGGRSGLRSNSGSISRGGSTAASMSVDQPFVGTSGGRRSGSNVGSSRGTRSTAVSGGGNKAKKQQQQQQGQQGAVPAAAAAEGAAGGKVAGSGRVQKGGGSTLSAAVSEARGAVAALDV